MLDTVVISLMILVFVKLSDALELFALDPRSTPPFEIGFVFKKITFKIKYLIGYKL